MKKSDTYKGGGNFIKADALSDGPVTYTIAGVESAEFDDGTQQRVLCFEETEQKFGMNVTNWETVADITGEDDDDNWAGHRITLYPTKTKFQGRTVPCVRVREPDEPAPAPAKPKTSKVLGKAAGTKIRKWCEDHEATIEDLAGTVDGFDLTGEPESWPFDAAAAIKKAMDDFEAVQADIPF